MSVDWSSVQPLHVIQRNGRVDEEAEESCANKVPEGDRNKEVDWPFVGGDPDLLLTGARQADVLPGFESDQHKWNNFECAEHGSQPKHDVWRSSEIKMMERADDSSGKEDHG